MSTPDAAAIDEVEREQHRAFFAAQRADRARQTRLTASKTSAAALGKNKAFEQVKQRIAYNLATKLIGEGLLSETLVVPLIAAALDNIRWFVVHILHGGAAVTVKWLPVPGVELPPLGPFEKLWLVFEDLVIIPLLLVTNPFVLVPIIVIIFFTT